MEHNTVVISITKTDNTVFKNTKKKELVFLKIPYLFQYQHLIGFGQNLTDILHIRMLPQQLHQKPGLPKTTSRTETY